MLQRIESHLPYWRWHGVVNMNKKSQIILKAIAAGNSWEQILAGDSTLTYHDIFHVVNEAPTRYWRKVSVGSPDEGWRKYESLARTPAKQRMD
jgi:hypothetical protein